jgi:alpha-ketoglutaric semialdehyde dehydrogenase
LNEGRRGIVELTGRSWLGGARAEAGARTFRGVNPATGEALGTEFHCADGAAVEAACRAAREAFATYGASAPAQRAAFLRAIADRLEAAREEVVARAQEESGLPRARLHSELGRTTGQLQLFADVAAEGSWVDARIDTADPSRKPMPRPDVRSMHRPLGPVAIFGASNFPLAFSVAGGDTASALAAGNPVVVKAHPAHPATSELAGVAVAEAAAACGIAPGVFSLLFDDGFAVGEALVPHPLIRAVGFTGSRAGGEALARLAAARPQPIPVYAEMGSVNPVLFLPGALRERGAALAEGLHASFTMGIGQFCTNPGLVLLPAGREGDAFAEQLAERTRATPAGTMLTPRIAGAYAAGQERLRSLDARLLAEGATAAGAASGRASVWQVDAAAVIANPALAHEVFGPSTMLVRYGGDEELGRLLDGLEGQLTATVHATPDELAAHAPVIRLLEDKAGRVVFDQFPTGVEVCPAMVHGGPVPATSDGRTTSVGTRAIERFTRLAAFQNAPASVLPAELQDANPYGLVRLVNGRRTSEPIASS